MNETTAAPKWQQIGPTERRILGVLVEKAKTTPEAYPLTLNAIRTGSNQKNNRFPQMTLEADQIEEALERLRHMEAVTEIVGDGRVPKYRHRLYDWLGVDKVEMAVMAELLLRGAQTVGELRGRAARMEPIGDLAALGPILTSLQAKKLILYLSPPGRGAVVTHTLYRDTELERLRKEYSASGGILSATEAVMDVADEPVSRVDPAAESPRSVPESSTSYPSRAPSTTSNAPAAPLAVLVEEVERLRAEVGTLREQMDQLRSELDETSGQLRRDVDDIRQQLGI